MQGPGPVVDEAEVTTGLLERLVDAQEIIGGDPNLVTELAGKADSADKRRRQADIHSLDREEGEGCLRNVSSHRARKQCTGLRTGDREPEKLAPKRFQGDARRWEVIFKPAHVVGLG